MIEYRVGDLFEYEGEAIAHGCNTKGLMGAGIAKIVAERYPEVHRFYVKSCGPYVPACDLFVPGDAQVILVDAQDRFVVNLATQDHPGAHATYWWVMLSMANMFERLRLLEIDAVAIPRIGCGIGGLKWHGVEEVIKVAQAHVPGVKVVVYTHPGETDKFQQEAK